MGDDGGQGDGAAGARPERDAGGHRGGWGGGVGGAGPVSGDRGAVGDPRSGRAVRGAVPVDGPGGDVAVDADAGDDLPVSGGSARSGGGAGGGGASGLEVRTASASGVSGV